MLYSAEMFRSSCKVFSTSFSLVNNNQHHIIRLHTWKGGIIKVATWLNGSIS